MANELNTWDDFYDAGLGPDLPLDETQSAQLVSGVLPSGEGNSFDFGQRYESRVESRANQGEGINKPFPYPNESTADEYANPSGQNNTFDAKYWEASGIFKTRQEDPGTPTPEQTGVFSMDELSSRFSNAEDIAPIQIDDFTVFNNYIHFEKYNDFPVVIPYLSTYDIAIDWNAYG